jgi:glycosyltransferase involved in cell wall biosynthesis
MAAIETGEKISFITAAFHARERIERAAACLIAQSCGQWEMIVSPDDGLDYAYLQKIDPRIRVVRTTEQCTGAGAARNRGLDIASGDYIGMLDDDDTLASNFVAEVLAALGKCNVVTAPIAYVSGSGRLIREAGTRQADIDIPCFALELASLPAICERSLHPRWHSCFAEDVLHTCEAISRAGGAIPVVRTTRYYCTVRTSSACASRKDIDAEYRNIIERLPEMLNVSDTRPVRKLFQLRRNMNAAFKAAFPQNAVRYHEFVASLRAMLTMQH